MQVYLTFLATPRKNSILAPLFFTKFGLLAGIKLMGGPGAACCYLNAQ